MGDSASVTTVLATGFALPESPRWHEGRLWFVDMPSGRVNAVDLEGVIETMAAVDGPVGGLGFLSDGSPIVVASRRRQVLKIIKGKVTLHADLTHVSAAFLNDMVVDESGRAFVGVISTDSDEGGDIRDDSIATIDPDGQWRIAARGLLRPNGLVITPDGGTLIYASTRRRKLMALTIGDNGMLSDQRLWAETGRPTPDGICFDAEGAIWLAGLSKCQFARIQPNGYVDRVISTGKRWALACVLGGPRRQTLFMTMCAEAPRQQPDIQGSVEMIDVDVPGAGWP